MEITDVEAIPVEVGVEPLEEEWGIAPYETGVNVTEATQRLLVRVETDEGVTGWGETALQPSAAAATAIVEDAIAPRVEGLAVWEMESVGGVFGPRGFGHPFMRLDAFRGAVETAMWDAFGKQLGAPLYELLGGEPTDGIPVAFCLGILDPEAAAEKARRAHEGGFEVLKTKAGRDWRTDVKRLTAMDEAVDGRLEFRVDANQAWNFEDAVRFGAAMEDAGVYLQYLEQPIRTDTYGAYKRLRERLRQPIGANEDLYNPHNFFHLVREDAVDVGVIDLVPAGGILAARRLAGVAAEAGVSLAHHSSFDLGVKTAAVLHTVASTPAMNLPPDRVNYALSDDVIDPRIELEGGEMAVPEGDGLGITVDEDRVERYRLDR